MNYETEVSMFNPTEEAVVEILEAFRSEVESDSLEISYATITDKNNNGLFRVDVEYNGSLDISDQRRLEGEVLLYSTTKGDVTLQSISNTHLTVELYNRT